MTGTHSLITRIVLGYLGNIFLGTNELGVSIEPTFPNSTDSRVPCSESVSLDITRDRTCRVRVLFRGILSVPRRLGRYTPVFVLYPTIITVPYEMKIHVTKLLATRPQVVIGTLSNDPRLRLLLRIPCTSSQPSTLTQTQLVL